MKEFIKKYSIFIFLSFLVVVLIFLKIIYGNTKNETAQITPSPTPTIIYPDPKTVKIEDLQKMDYQTLTNYLNHLTKDQINSLPEEQPVNQNVSTTSASSSGEIRN
jgi:hypothetical protein